MILRSAFIAAQHIGDRIQPFFASARELLRENRWDTGYRGSVSNKFPVKGRDFACPIDQNARMIDPHSTSMEAHRARKQRPSNDHPMCVAKVIDGRISVSEQFLRRGCRTDGTASDDANGPVTRPLVLPKPAHRTGTSPIADLDPQGIDYRGHSQLSVVRCPLCVVASTGSRRWSGGRPTDNGQLTTDQAGFNGAVTLESWKTS